MTSNFLKLVKDFYEKNDFNEEKLKVKEEITGNKLEDNLKTNLNYELIKNYYEKAIETK